jgi:hypothetical protein
MGFVQKHEKFPNVEELLIFNFNRYIEAGKCGSLPYLAGKWASNVV